MRAEFIAHWFKQINGHLLINPVVLSGDESSAELNYALLFRMWPTLALFKAWNAHRIHCSLVQAK